MKARQLSSVVTYLQRTQGRLQSLSDRLLLERFANDRDEAAFETLMHRHAQLVLNVCWRLLQHSHDAEDAFQATFLVLARKAKTVAWRESIAGWLHEVACRVAAEARTRVGRQRMREHPLNSLPDLPGASSSEPSEIPTLLDEELRRLPEKYRAPLVLCCLEGLSRDEAAQQLGWTVGAVKGRLERGRLLLARRLARKGITLAAVLTPALLPSLTRAAVSPALVRNTLQLASSFVANSSNLANSSAVTLAVQVLQRLSPPRLTLLLMTTFLALAAAGSASAFLTSSPISPLEPASPFRGEVPVFVPVPEKTTVPGAPRLLFTLRHNDVIRRAVLTPDGKIAATASFDGTVRTWDVGTGKPLSTWIVAKPNERNLLTSTNSALACSTNGKVLFVGTAQGELAAWEMATQKVLFRTLTKQRNVYDLAVSPNGKVLATANHLGSVSLWDAQTGKLIREWSAHPRRVWSVAFAPDGKAVASAGEDGMLCVWDTATGKQKVQMRAHRDYTAGVAFNPDGKMLASLGYDDRLCLWNATTGKLMRSGEAPSGATVLFFHDGKTLLTTDRVGGFHLWDVKTLDRLHSSMDHEGPVHHAALSVDQQRVITASEDHAARIYDVSPRPK